MGKEGQLVIKEERPVDTSPNTDFSTLRFLDEILKCLESEINGVLPPRQSVYRPRFDRSTFRMQV